MSCVFACTADNAALQLSKLYIKLSFSMTKLQEVANAYHTWCAALLQVVAYNIRSACHYSCTAFSCSQSTGLPFASVHKQVKL